VNNSSIGGSQASRAEPSITQRNTADRADEERRVRCPGNRFLPKIQRTHPCAKSDSVRTLTAYGGNHTSQSQAVESLSLLLDGLERKN